MKKFLMLTISKLISVNQNLFFIHDREKAIVNSVKKFLLFYHIENNVFLCLLHIYLNVKRYVTKRTKKIKHQIKKIDKPVTDFDTFIEAEKLLTKDDEEDCEDNAITEEKTKEEELLNELKSLSQFRNDLYHLRMIKNLNEFDSQLIELKKRWSKIDSQYYTKNIHNDLRMNVANRQVGDLDEKFNNIEESMNSYIKKFTENRKMAVDILVLALYNFTTTFVEKFNFGYKKLNNLKLKTKFEKMKSRSYPSSFKIDVRTELMAVKDNFKLIELKEKSQLPRNLSQVYLGEYIFKNLTIEQIGSCFIVPDSNNKNKYVVEWCKDKYICHCGLKNCQHQKAVELKVFGETTGNIIEDKNFRDKDNKKRGRKGPDECYKNDKKFKTELNLSESLELDIKIETDLSNFSKEVIEVDSEIVDELDDSDELASKIKDGNCLTDTIIERYLLLKLKNFKSDEFLFIPCTLILTLTNLSSFFKNNLTNKTKNIVFILNTIDLLDSN